MMFKQFLVQIPNFISNRLLCCCLKWAYMTRHIPKSLGLNQKTCLINSASFVREDSFILGLHKSDLRNSVLILIKEKSYNNSNLIQ